MGAARETKEDTNMATIGTFTSNGNGFTGTVKTLALDTVRRRSFRVERTSEKAPTSASSPATSNWAPPGRRPSKDTGRDYLSVKLDDPSFPAPIYATLIEVEGEEGLAHLVPAEPGLTAPRRGPAARRGLRA